MDKKLTMLMILDGFGNNTNEKGNAVKNANTPNIDKLMKTCPTTEINTSGLAVGLPEGQMGNSEVGHTNIGAGRVVYQELTRITKSIEDGDFFSVPEFVKAIENCKQNNSKLHIMGLVSEYSSKISQEIDPTESYSDGLQGYKSLPSGSVVLITEQFSIKDKSYYKALFNGKAFFINAKNIKLTDEKTMRKNVLRALNVKRRVL